MHFIDNPKDSQKLKDIVGDNPLTKSMDNQEKEHCRHESFESIRVLVSAANELYTKGDMEFDAMVENLAKALVKLKGKESELAQSEEMEAPEEDQDES